MDDQAVLGEHQKNQKRAGAPRWMVTFADLMSLLFALFVLLVSFANFDERKFAESSGPMREAFNVSGDVKDKPNMKSTSILIGRPAPIEIDRSAQRKEMVLRRLDVGLVEEIAKKMVTIEERNNGVLIRFPNATAFSSGGAELSDQAYVALDKIVDILVNGDENILVSGHTDDIPISNEIYRSNWDLSSARASSVVHYFLDRKVVKKRITSQGFADSRPLVDNKDQETRATNRRVEIFIEIPDEDEDKKEKPYKSLLN
ncbi:MAG: OmpA family protein [Alphaproteobacteria bacterium]|nr:OmpA family protein [Rhodospirillales bacterium]MCW9044842.1 OmpA family protein [Alphaproteobacteria bacterium]